MNDKQNDKQANNPLAATDKTTQQPSNTEIQAQRNKIDKKVAEMPTEYGGRSKDKGLEPTRYNDWELKGRCIDF